MCWVLSWQICGLTGSWYTVSSADKMIDITTVRGACEMVGLHVSSETYSRGGEMCYLTCNSEYRPSAGAYACTDRQSRVHGRKCEPTLLNRES